MEELTLTTEDEVILAFVTAELDSPRWGPLYSAALQQLGVTADELIVHADLGDTKQNQQRRKLLRAVRGYPNTALFQGFPRDVRWRRVRLAPDELTRLKYAKKMEGWVKLAGGTQSVLAAARNLDRADPDTRQLVELIAGKVRRGAYFQPLITLEAEDGSLILVEGYARATAYAAAPVSEPVEIFVGSSPGIPAWAWY